MTVTLYDPTLSAVHDSFDELDDVTKTSTGLRLQLMLDEEGMVDSLNVTLPESPLITVTFMVDMAVSPRTAVSVGGVEPMAKSGLLLGAKLRSSVTAEPFTDTNPSDEDRSYPGTEVIEYGYVPFGLANPIVVDVDDMVDPSSVTDQRVPVASPSSLKVIE